MRAVPRPSRCSWRDACRRTGSRGNRGSSHRRQSPTPISSRSSGRSAGDSECRPSWDGSRRLKRGTRTASALRACRLPTKSDFATPCTGRARVDPGCLPSANDAVFGLRDRLLSRLRPALADLDARIAADPGAVHALDAWRACVASIAGGVVPERPAFAQRLIARFDAQVQGLGTTPASMAGLFALQTDERRVAAILAGCEAAFARIREQVAAPFEAGFVAHHRDGLASVGAAIRDAEAALPTLPP